MIRRGRHEGWLKQPVDRLEQWAKLSGGTFQGIRVGPVLGSEHRGSAVIATRQLVPGLERPLMTVPRDLVLSLESIHAEAKRFKLLEEIFDALGDFGKTARGAILVYLLLQTTIANPKVPKESTSGLADSMKREYIKFLPWDENLPTFWNGREHELLTGTTLKPAIEAKLKSLHREFDQLRSATEEISWCAEHWWDDYDGWPIEFDDWMLVDAMYRSRALEFPGIGDAMVPCIDMANHASGEATTALYDVNKDGDVELVLRKGDYPEIRKLEMGDEVTITYGDDKGMCEMVFSYGFVEDTMTSARQLFLDIDMPEDDPLKRAKMHVSNAAPGFTIFEKGSGVAWEGEFIWLVVVNEEDGLEFKVLQTTDGGRELKVYWQDDELKDVSTLKTVLEKDEKWEVFQLRAVATLQDRVESQLRTLYVTADAVERADHGDGIRDGPYQLALKLRKHEDELLERAYEVLENEKVRLAQTETVQRYLASSAEQQPEAEPPVEAEESEEDFT